MGRFAVVDIGTNSVKMCVADVAGDRLIPIADEVRVTRLGEGVHATGRIGEAAITRTVDALREIVDEIRSRGAGEWAAVGTMALRRARNATEFIDRVREACGLEIEVIPGEEEARLSFLAALTGIGPVEGRVCVFDTGGGSTEVIFGHGSRIVRRYSIEVGARRPTEELLRTDPVTDREMESLLEYVDRGLGKFARWTGSLIGVGGTLTSLASVMHRMVEYDRDTIQGSVLTAAEVDRQIETYRRLPIEGRKKVVGLVPERADIILAGATIVGSVMRKLGVAELTVSDGGLRHGVLYDRFVRRAPPDTGTGRAGPIDP
jgi:exopolyphosphatase/guanosine-5'-triphosphate,3'-diphosphate pyrophosphatase